MHHMVKLYGQNIPLVEKDGEPYVAVKPICKILGISWQGQHAKLRGNKKWQASLIPVSTSGGVQKMLCIPLRKLGQWILSVSSNKVKKDSSRKVIEYQEMLEKILWYRWKKLSAEQADSDVVPDINQIPVLEVLFPMAELKLQEELKRELINRFLKLAVRLENTGAKLSTAVRIARGRKIGFTTEQLARALELEVDTVARIEAICRKAGFWKYLSSMD